MAEALLEGDQQDTSNTTLLGQLGVDPPPQAIDALQQWISSVEALSKSIKNKQISYRVSIILNRERKHLAHLQQKRARAEAK